VIRIRVIQVIEIRWSNIEGWDLQRNPKLGWELHKEEKETQRERIWAYLVRVIEQQFSVFKHQKL